MRTSVLAIFWFVLSFSNFSWAQNLTFFQSTDLKEMGLDDTLELTVTIENAPENSEFIPPKFRDFEELSSSQSTQNQVFLGGGGIKMQSQTLHFFRLQPRRVGMLQIPPSTLKVGSKTHQTGSIKINVRAGSLRQRTARRSNPSRMPDLFGDADPLEEMLRNSPFSRQRNESDVQLVMELDRTDAYVGQPLVCTISAVSSVELSAIDSMKMPKFDGFWTEDFGSPKEVSGRTDIIDGELKHIYLIRRTVLFPMKSGEFTLSPFEADLSTLSFFNDRSRLHRQSNSRMINVKPFPSGAPLDFVSTNVGTLRLGWELSAKVTTIGKPVTFKLWVEGEGNIKKLQLPTLKLPPSLSAYEPTRTDVIDDSSAEYGGRSTLEWLIRPNEAGTFTLPPLIFHFFDPKKQRFEQVQTEAYSLDVLPSVASTAVSSNSQTQPAFNPNSNLAASLPLRVEETWRSATTPLWASRWFLGGVLAPLCLLAVFEATQRLRTQNRRHGARRALASQRFWADAQAALKSDQRESFFQAVELGVHALVERVTGKTLSGLSHSQAGEAMLAAGMPPERVTRVISLLERCEAGRFAPRVTLEPGFETKILKEFQELMEGWPSR